MGKSKALETALNNKLLSSHEHLKKGIFSPPPVLVLRGHISKYLPSPRRGQAYYDPTRRATTEGLHRGFSQRWF